MMDWIFAPLGWLFARYRNLRDWVGRTLLRSGKHFYVLLAVTCLLAGGWDQFVHPFSGSLSNASFDWLMQHRPIPYVADPAIVVLDIDETSLAEMSARYGRWPWPREVLAQVGANLESHGARAVVFDILFADPDTRNPDSEVAFDRFVKNSRVSFFPILRLNPHNDGASEITLSMLNFASPEPAGGGAQIQPARTIALLPPYFKSIYDSSRMGTHNVYPDTDNVVRWHQNYEALAGYRIPSLPYRMAEALHWPVPQRPRGLINWPRGATPYTTIPFVRALQAAQGGNEAFFTALAGKIILIGSTAPSLNDIKATPVDNLDPGIYILATAIDNTRHASFLRPLHPLVIWLVELLLLVPSTYMFVRTELSQITARGFVIIPTALLGISLLSVSVSNLLADLSAPIAMVLTYFTIATVFEKQQANFAFGIGIFAPCAAERATRLQIACLPGSFSRQRVLELLERCKEPLKLWRPTELGLGSHWVAQGWVLWRWAPLEANSGTGAQATTIDGVTLRWIDVQAGGSDNAFSVARAVSSAAGGTVA
jgi:CHASE2 domain-containing sensor protein